MKKWIVVIVMLAACGSEDKPVLGNTNNSQIDVGADTGSESDAGLADATADQGVDQGTSGTCATQADCLYAIGDNAVVDVDGGITRETVIGRDLPLLLNMPTVAGPAPVVVFSHGGSFEPAGQNNNKKWGALLARNGFVVIHIGHSLVGAGQGTKVCTAANVPQTECSPGEEDNGLLTVIRAYDIAAVLDDLPRISELSQANNYPALDLDRVAVMGWSAGSRGPSVLMGAKMLTTANSPLFRLPHATPKVAVMLSPAGPGTGGYFANDAENSWDEMRGPIFFATGTNDVKPASPELTGAVRRQAFDLQPAEGNRYLLYSNLEVGIGGHGTYDLGDANSDGPLADLSLALSASVLAFLDAELNGSDAAKAWLASDKALLLAGDAEWSKK